MDNPFWSRLELSTGWWLQHELKGPHAPSLQLGLGLMSRLVSELNRDNIKDKKLFVAASAGHPTSTTPTGRMGTSSTSATCSVSFSASCLSHSHYRKSHFCHVHQSLLCVSSRAHGKHKFCLSVLKKTHGKTKVHGKVIICRVLFFAHSKEILCSVFFWHTVK